MTTFLERVNQVVETAGKRAQAAVERTRLLIEQQRVRGERQHHHAELGRLIHAEGRGTAPNPARRDELMVAIDKAEADLARIERELAAVKGEVVSVQEEPAPPPPAE
jgi:hypothetical protein